MSDLLANPAVQGGVAPFVAGLVIAVLLGRFRLGGLAVVAAFATAVYFIAGFNFSPLNATRKIILLGFAAPIAGIVVDFAFRPTRLGSIILAIAAAAAAAWVFWPVLSQKELARALLPGATALLAAAWVVGYSEQRLAGDSVRTAASGLALGAGTAVAAIFGAALTYGLYGAAIAAGSGAFLLVQMITGKRSYAGATFTLSATVVTILIASAAMILAQLPWYSVAVLALVPVAAGLPLPAGAALWLQAVLSSFYGLVVAGIACALAWHAGG
ncbi:MAG TPA: hypothetical protein VMS53_08415 [Burkholderiales bacterium]|nr:hypothetical protein [Burkholderiales bacterium]